MAFFVVEADTNDFDTILFQIADAVAEAACLFGTTRRVVFRIEIEQHNLLAGGVGKLPGFTLFGFAGDERGFIADFRTRVGGSGLSRNESRREQEARDDGNSSERFGFHGLQYWLWACGCQMG